MRRAMGCHIIGRIDCAKRSIFKSGLIAVVALLSIAICVYGKDKENPDSLPMNPYTTAEEEDAPSINPDDLAYKIILFDEVKIPENYRKKQKSIVKYVDETVSMAISRLRKTMAFAKVDKVSAPFPEEPYLHVRCALLDYRIVGGGSRFFAGVLAGTSYMTYAVKIYSGVDKKLLHEREITTENNPFSGYFGGQDKAMPFYLGRVIADYLALRARKDQGAALFPPEAMIPDDEIFVDLESNLMWAAKDNHEETSWDEAKQYAKDFRAGGYADWRLPNDVELLSLFDKNDTTRLSNQQEISIRDKIKLTGHLCWTNLEKKDKARYVDFTNGETQFAKKKEVTSYRALVVRVINDK